jgi:DNA-binding helix-hairpin-helix protein with protein kinase domain
MGRHPYAGIREGRRDFEFEESIADFLFAFSPQTKALGVQPPPHTLPFAAMPNNVARLLEKAFLRGSEKDGARPSGKEWHRALEFMQQNRCVCARDAGHVYPSHLGRCPWCEIYDAGGPNFFSSTTEPPSPVTIETITAYWAAIERVARRSLKAKELSDFQRLPNQSQAQRGPRRTGPGYEIGWIFFAASIPLFAVSAWVAGSAAAIGLALIIIYSRDKKRRAELRLKRRNVEQARKEVEASIENARRAIEEYNQQFKKRKLKLRASHLRLIQLDQEKQRELGKLEGERRELQLNAFLDKILLRDHPIVEVGPRLIATLQAYGIESALDITRGMYVPGINKGLQNVLETWKRHWEAEFRFDPDRPLPTRYLREIEVKAADLRRSLENELSGGPQGLVELGAAAEGKLDECNLRTAAAARRYVEAQAELRAAE